MPAILFCPLFTVQAQDSTRVLSELVVHAYAADRPLNEVPVAIGVVQPENLNRFSNTSLVPVFNAIPGVRMEERSPASYRFSIRGSSLRSPFGVRNVKFYWNGMPLTDGGGNTYLNLLDFSALGNAEVIKGPGGSLYGAGTGGVVLLASPSIRQNEFQVSAQAGSYGQQRYQVLAQSKSENILTSIRYAHLQADGYRVQSAMRRDVLNADMSFLIDPRNTLTTSVFYTDLYYQTPGGLTQAQYNADGKQARPSSATMPGAEQQQAAVFNKTFFGGVNYEHEWNESWSSRLAIFGSNTDFKNPSIRNYEARTEKNLGVRSENQFRSKQVKITFGGELQYFTSPILVTSNNQGVPGTQIFSNDDISSLLTFGFAQAELDLPRQFFLTLGGSLSFLRYKDNRLALTPPEMDVRNFDLAFSPRIALLKKFSPQLSTYLSASKGFSPPSVAEVVPSTGIYNPGLNPETGWSYEAGLRGNFLSRFDFSLALYDFELDQTIVIQRDASGADYFVNAGNTSQKGAEVGLGWTPSLNAASIHLWTSYTYNHYRFGKYVNDGNDYSGNMLTGVAPNIFVFGGDVQFPKGLYFHITGNFTDHMPLNDANTDFATNYFLLGARAGYKFKTRFPIEVFIGIDNALDKKYSLGNDLNAAGGRYFNAASRQNFFGGLIVKFHPPAQDESK